MPPQANILLSVNGGDPTEGPVTVAPGDTIQPIAESMAYWSDPPAVWRIKSWPEDWPGPGVGWTFNEASEAYEFIGNETPPEISITSTTGLFGKWLLDLIVMGGVFEGVPDDSLICSIGWKLPSAELGLTGIALWENDQFDPVRLWPGEVTSQLKKVEVFAANVGAPSEASFVAGKQTTSETTNVTISTRKFNPSGYNPNNRVITFLAWLRATSGATATLELYNLTTAATVHTFTSTSAVGELKSQVLTVPTNLPNSSNNYELRLKRTGGSPGDTVECHSAYMEISYT
jgi:hypothetical protein